MDKEKYTRKVDRSSLTAIVQKASTPSDHENNTPHEAQATEQEVVLEQEAVFESNKSQLFPYNEALFWGNKFLVLTFNLLRTVLGSILIFIGFKITEHFFSIEAVNMSLAGTIIAVTFFVFYSLDAFFSIVGHSGIAKYTNGYILNGVVWIVTMGVVEGEKTVLMYDLSSSNIESIKHTLSGTYFTGEMVCLDLSDENFNKGYVTPNLFVPACLDNYDQFIDAIGAEDFSSTEPVSEDVFENTMEEWLGNVTLVPHAYFNLSSYHKAKHYIMVALTTLEVMVFAADYFFTTVLHW